MKQRLSLILVLCLLLCGCAPAAPATDPSSSSSTLASSSGSVPGSSSAVTPPSSVVTPPSSAVTPPSSVPSLPPETEPVLPYQNPLNGTPLAAPYTGRPVAVMLNNHRNAQPQIGVGSADILYEILAEGGITRCMGVFSDISQVGQLCSIRSARKYYVDIVRGYGALYAHAGGSDEALNYIASIGLDHLDGVYSGGSFYKRDQDRLNAGYSSEHTLYTTGQWILNGAAYMRYTMTTENASYGLSFDDGAVIAGQSAKKLTVHFNMSGRPDSYTKSTAFAYDSDTKLYSASQFGSSYIDGATDKTLTFRNILVLRASTSVQSDGKLLTIQTTGTGSGYFFCNGQAVPIKWSRSSVTEPFSYTLENGTPITFGVGKTYIAVVPTGATVTFE